MKGHFDIAADAASVEKSGRTAGMPADRDAIRPIARTLVGRRHHHFPTLVYTDIPPAEDCHRTDQTDGCRVILSKPEPGYRPDIDGLRALSVAVVILFHLDVSWLPGGFVGVDVFFVISGFLITSLIIKRINAGTFSLIDFYERRFRRIYPNLIIVIVATMVIGWFTLIPSSYRLFGRTAVWASLSASNFAFMTGNGYFDPASISKPLLHTWSLGVEEQFYLLFPWVLLLAARYGLRSFHTIAALVGLSLLLSVTGAMVGWPKSYFLLPTRFWELGLGALVTTVPFERLQSYLWRSVLGISGLTAIIWSSVYLSQSDHFPGYLALVPTLGAAAVIMANGGVANRVLSLAPFTWVGRLSFALYLWHWPFIVTAAGVGFLPTETGARLFVISASLLLSVIGYHAWEVPIRRRRLLTTRRSLFVALAVSVIGIIGSGITLYTSKGMPQRMPPELADIAGKAQTNSRLITRQCALANAEEPYTCPLGSKDAPDVSFLIIGDSHAEAVGAEIGDIAGKYGLRGFYMGRSGCRSFAEPSAGEDPSCDRQTDFIIQTYLNAKPELVIAIVRWSSVLNGEKGNTPDMKKYDAVRSVFGNTLTMLSDSSVLTAITVPEYNIDIPEAGWHSYFRQRFGLSTLPAPTISVEQYRARQQSSVDLLNQEKAQHPNLRVLDPATVFCPDGTCVSTIGNEPLYYDDDHLSHAGALIYARMMEPYFAELAAKLSSKDGPPQVP